jgi:hypothetical protein
MSTPVTLASSHASTPNTLGPDGIDGDGPTAASKTYKTAADKKKKVLDKEEDEDGKPSKRQKITYSNKEG